MRVLDDSVVAMGPGKADLLDAIVAHGSISGAARAMHMSYRRAWLLVDTMNACFRLPLVTAEKGGVDGGGTTLTPMGRRVLKSYRALSKRVGADFAPYLRPPRRKR